eukprot:PITA_33416
MGRGPCCEKTGLKKGPWTPEEDKILINYIQKNGHESWRTLPELAGLLRCGKSCRLRWTNYLRPDIKRGSFTREEEQTIILLHGILGNKWSAIASQLPGRADNEIKNFWNTHLKKRLLKMGLDPATHKPTEEANPTTEGFEALALTRHKAQWENARLEAEARLSRESLLISSNSAAGYHINKTVEITTIPSDNQPTDYFLKIWNSEAGKVFRKEKENHLPIGGDNPVLISEIFLSSVSSLCCSSTQNSCDQSFNPNDKNKENGSQQCNSASFELIGDCNLKTPEVLSCFADMTTCQTEDKVPDELDFPRLLLDFSDNDDKINNNNSIQSDFSATFQGQHPSPWAELHEDYWSNLLSDIANASPHS